MKRSNEQKNTQNMSAPVHVVVVGAGMAGVSCAWNLLKKNKNVTVTLLEARNRIGGRMVTYYDDEESVYVDLGASWIHGHKGNPLTVAVESLGVQLSEPDRGFDDDESQTTQSTPVTTTHTTTVTTATPPSATATTTAHTKTVAEDETNKTESNEEDEEQFVIDVTGEAVNPAIAKDMNTEVRRFIKYLTKKKSEELTEDISLEEALQTFDAKAQIISKLQKKYHDILKNHDSQFLHRQYEVVCSYYQGFNGALLSQLSTKYYADECYFEGGDRYVIGGYSTVLRRMLQQLEQQHTPASLLLSHHVTTVSFDPTTRRVCVTGTCNGNSSNHFRVDSDCVVVTVPIPLLKHPGILFDPPLSRDKVNAIQRIGYGLLDKVMLIFTEIFWDINIDWFGYSADTREECLAIMNPHYYSKTPFTKNKNTNSSNNETNKGNNTNNDSNKNDNYNENNASNNSSNESNSESRWMLVTFLNSERAKQWEQGSDTEVTEYVLSILTRHYGNRVRKHFVKSWMTRWALDPLAQGSYCFAALGSSPRDFEVIAQPSLEGHLYWAGEATIRKYYSTAHGAYMSGERAAVEISENFQLVKL